MATTYDWNDAAYAELASEAAKDDRVGDHTFLVTERREEQWPSGDPRIKVLGVLTTARSAKAPEVVKEMMGTWEPNKKRAISATISLYAAMQKHYGKTPETLDVGDEINVKTAKNKDGFIRVVAILPPGPVGDEKADANMPGF